MTCCQIKFLAWFERGLGCNGWRASLPTSSGQSLLFDAALLSSHTLLQSMLEVSSSPSSRTRCISRGPSPSFGSDAWKRRRVQIPLVSFVVECMSA